LASKLRRYSENQYVLESVEVGADFPAIIIKNKRLLSSFHRENVTDLIKNEFETNILKQSYLSKIDTDSTMVEDETKRKDSTESQKSGLVLSILEKIHRTMFSLIFLRLHSNEDQHG